MSAESPISSVSARVTPGVDGRRPALQKSDTAVRAAVGRHTVDIVPTDRGLLAIAGDGVGRAPVTAEIGPAVAAVVLATADTVDERTAWRTQAWPLAC